MKQADVLVTYESRLRTHATSTRDDVTNDRDDYTKRRGADSTSPRTQFIETMVQYTVPNRKRNRESGRGAEGKGSALFLPQHHGTLFTRLGRMWPQNISTSGILDGLHLRRYIWLGGAMRVHRAKIEVRTH